MTAGGFRGRRKSDFKMKTFSVRGSQRNREPTRRFSVACPSNNTIQKRQHQAVSPDAYCFTSTRYKTGRKLPPPESLFSSSSFDASSSRTPFLFRLLIQFPAKTFPRPTFQFLRTLLHAQHSSRAFGFAFFIATSVTHSAWSTN